MQDDNKCPVRSLTIVSRPISELKFNSSNPRQHSRKQITQIAKSIATFGFNVPILVDSELKIIAGHGRALAAQELGLDEIPTISLDHLTDAQVRAFTIADNRLTETSSWNDRLLAEQLKDLSLLDLDFSLDVIGFDMGEIDFRIESLAVKPADDSRDPLDDVPALSTKAVSAVGDLWTLNQHRILCANALEDTSYRTLMAGAQATAVLTDPPYNVPVRGHVISNTESDHREFVMASGEMSPSQFQNFLNGSLLHATAHLCSGAILYVFMDWRHSLEIQTAGTSADLDLKNICVWVKSNGGMGSFYRSQHEFIFVFKHGKASHRNNIELGRHGRCRTNVWEYPGCNSFERQSAEGNLLDLHPTVKPVRLLADAMLDCTSRNDIVLDNFLGSGSTLLAAERVGRKLYGIELDPLYVDVAIRRWQRATGGQAIHAITGRCFDEIAATKEAA
jgi:DNA modification methylase